MFKYLISVFLFLYREGKHMGKSYGYIRVSTKEQNKGRGGAAALWAS